MSWSVPFHIERQSIPPTQEQLKGTEQMSFIHTYLFAKKNKIKKKPFTNAAYYY
jgi:hypothetical protein